MPLHFLNDNVPAIPALPSQARTTLHLHPKQEGNSKPFSNLSLVLPLQSSCFNPRPPLRFPVNPRPTPHTHTHTAHVLIKSRSSPSDPYEALVTPWGPAARLYDSPHDRWTRHSRARLIGCHEIHVSRGSPCLLIDSAHNYWHNSHDNDGGNKRKLRRMERNVRYVWSIPREKYRKNEQMQNDEVTIYWETWNVTFLILKSQKRSLRVSASCLQIWLVHNAKHHLRGWEEIRMWLKWVPLLWWRWKLTHCCLRSWAPTWFTIIPKTMPLIRPFWRLFPFFRCLDFNPFMRLFCWFLVGWPKPSECECFIGSSRIDTSKSYVHICPGPCFLDVCTNTHVLVHTHTLY